MSSYLTINGILFRFSSSQKEEVHGHVTSAHSALRLVWQLMLLPGTLKCLKTYSSILIYLYLNHRSITYKSIFTHFITSKCSVPPDWPISPFPRPTTSQISRADSASRHQRPHSPIISPTFGKGLILLLTAAPARFSSAL
jgi:hypothetical protein